MFLVRIFKAMFAMLLILAGLTVIGVIYLFKNPEKISQGFNYVIEKGMSGKVYEENEEYFLQGIQKIRVDAPQINIHIRYGNTSTMKVFLKGRISIFDGGPFLVSRNVQDELLLNVQTNINSQLRVNINGEDIQPQAEALGLDILLPEAYKNSVSVLTHTGSIQASIPDDVFILVNAKTQNGEIKNSYRPKTNPTDSSAVGSLELNSNLGNITITNQ